MCRQHVHLLVENFDEVVYGLEIREIIVVDVDANAKVEASITTIDDFEITKLKADDRGRRQSPSELTSTKLNETSDVREHVHVGRRDRLTWCVWHRGR
jgi:hypothetical protein